MIEWEVLDDNPTPEEQEDKSASGIWSWRGWLLLLVVILSLGALAFWWRLQLAEGRLRADIERVVAVEERALRLGVTERAPELADPAARVEWLGWYQGTFEVAADEVPKPEVLTIDHEEDRALVRLGYETDETEWQEVRAYRVVGNRWRRAPIPEDLWGPVVPHLSEHFLLSLNARDAELLPPEALLETLEEFHEAFIPLWPETHRNLISLHITPAERFPDVRYNVNRVYFTSPLLVPYDRGYLPQARAYQLMMLEAIATSFGYARLKGDSSTFAAERAVLRPALRNALVRHLFLTPEEQDAYRQRLRAEYAATQNDSNNLLFEPSRLAFFAEYLIETQGLAAAGDLMSAYDESASLEQAVKEVTGYSLDLLDYGATRWLVTGTLPPLALDEGGIGQAQLSWINEKEDGLYLTLVPTNHKALEVKVAEDAELSLPRTCLPTVNELLFHLIASSEPTPQIDEISVLTRHESLSTLEPLGDGPQTLILRQTDAGNDLLTRDPLGQEKWVGTLPADIHPIFHAEDKQLAYLLSNECGKRLYRHDLSSGESTTVLVTQGVPQHAFWLGRGLVVLLRPKNDALLTDWHLNAMIMEEEGPLLRFRSSNKGQFIGHHLSTNRSLVLLQGELYWASVGYAQPLEKLSLDLEAPIEIGALSPDGRWLAYTIHHPDNQADLYALDLDTNQRHLLDTLAPDSAHGEMAWSIESGSLLTLAVVLGELGAGRQTGNTLLRYQWSVDYRFARNALRTNGEIDHLHWCPNRRLFFRLSRDGVNNLIEVRGNELVRIAEGDRIVGCVEG